MSAPSPGNVTQLLRKWGTGDLEALDELVPLVYSELRSLSRHYLSRGRPNQSLQATALINEAFVRLIDQDGIDWQNRAHFFGVAARTMRNILVDHARRHRAQKRGGGAEELVFDERIAVVDPSKGRDLLALDEALTSLSAVDENLSQLVELRFFGGLSVRESAAVLKVSQATINRWWRTAKIWLRHELKQK